MKQIADQGRNCKNCQDQKKPNIQHTRCSIINSAQKLEPDQQAMHIVLKKISLNYQKENHTTNQTRQMIEKQKKLNISF